MAKEFLRELRLLLLLPEQRCRFPASPPLFPLFLLLDSLDSWLIRTSSWIRFQPLRSTVSSSSDSPQVTEMALKNAQEDQDPRLARISSAIRVIPDFPKPGAEARGFIFGPPIALAIGAKFVPMGKPKKSPGEVVSEEYSLEYGTDKMKMHVGAVQPGERALVIDDLIATKD